MFYLILAMNAYVKSTYPTGYHEYLYNQRNSRIKLVYHHVLIRLFYYYFSLTIFKAQNSATLSLDVIFKCNKPQIRIQIYVNPYTHGISFLTA